VPDKTCDAKVERAAWDQVEEEGQAIGVVGAQLRLIDCHYQHRRRAHILA